MIASMIPIVRNVFCCLSIFFIILRVCFGRMTIKRPSRINSAAKIAITVVCQGIFFIEGLSIKMYCCRGKIASILCARFARSINMKPEDYYWDIIFIEYINL